MLDIDKPSIAYRSVRPHVVTGDAILWKGRSLVARMIRLWTPFNHASLVVRLQRYDTLEQRVFLVEALASGLELRLLSKRLENYDGEAFWFHVEMTEEQRSQILDFALTTCASGIPYDYESLFKNILGRVSADATKYFCSEFVFDAWVHAGVTYYPPSGSAPRPGDIPNWVKGVFMKITS